MKIVMQLTYSFVDSTSMLKKNEYYCNTATYHKSNLEDFVLQCTPYSWEDFFTRKEVISAIKFADDIRSPYKVKIAPRIGNEIKKITKYHIEPPMQLMFEAFKRVKPQDVKVVILGQDPTPQEGKATGKAFSVKNPRTVGSVINVLLEVAYEGWSVDLDNGDLSKWEDQGVLLLNSALTIGEIRYDDQKGKSKTLQVSHLDNWGPFTNLLIKYISENKFPSVWMLWGNVAQSYSTSIEKGYILSGGHPSPLSGAKTANTFLLAVTFIAPTNFFLKPVTSR